MILFTLSATETKQEAVSIVGINDSSSTNEVVLDLRTDGHNLYRKLALTEDEALTLINGLSRAILSNKRRQ